MATTIARETRIAMLLKKSFSRNGSVTARTVSIVSTASMFEESASVCGSYLSAAAESRQKKMVTWVYRVQGSS